MAQAKRHAKLIKCYNISVSFKAPAPDCINSAKHDLQVGTHLELVIPTRPAEDHQLQVACKVY